MRKWQMNFTSQYGDNLINILYSLNKSMIYGLQMSSFSRWNKDYKYLSTVIDVFSKYGWIVPLNTKTGKVVAQAIRKLVLNGHPSRVGTE